jgi:hypothetical protein
VINHLSSEQISKCVSGEGAPEELQHSRECESCSAEVTRVQALLSDFRGAVSQWAEQLQAGPSPTMFALRPRRTRWAPAAVAVAAAATAIAVIPVYRNSQERERQAQAAQQAQDAQLLERVNLQLSQTAPESLQPLMDLISDTKTDASQGERR